MKIAINANNIYTDLKQRKRWAIFLKGIPQYKFYVCLLTFLVFIWGPFTPFALFPAAPLPSFLLALLRGQKNPIFMQMSCFKGRNNQEPLCTVILKHNVVFTPHQKKVAFRWGRFRWGRFWWGRFRWGWPRPGSALPEVQGRLLLFLLR